MVDSFPSSHRDMAVITGVIRVVCLLCCLPVSYSTECEAPFGVAEKSKISDDQLSASAPSKGGHRAQEGRLNGPKAWRPNGNDGANSAVGQWIQVTFDILVKATKIATQGRNPDDNGREDNEFVTRYKVQYINNEDSLMYIKKSADDTAMVFNGNVDRGGTVGQILHNAVLLKGLRIEIVQCSIEGCALRFELYGCQVPMCEVLEEPNNGRITNSGTDFTGRQTIECNAGFTPKGGDISTVCTATGNGSSAGWEPDISSTICEEYTPASTTANRYTPASTTVEEYKPASTTAEKYTPASTTAEKYTPASTTAERYTQAPATAEKYTLAPTTAERYTLASTTAERYSPASTTISSTSFYSMKDERMGSRRSNPGAVAGSVIGVLLVIVIIIIVVIWLLKRKRETAKPTPQSGQAFDGPYELTIEGNNGPAKTQPTMLGQPDQEEYAYVDVNRANTPQNEDKPDTGDIYQDVQDKPDEYAYAYADVNASKTADEPSDDGLVQIYAKSKHGGRPITKDKQNPAADTGDIYQSIQEAPNENEYAYADVKVDANGKPAKPQEGWEDNVIYAAGNDDEGIAADKGKEGWVDNNIYATTDNDEQNAEGKSQVEGWEDNVIYGDK